MSVNRKSGKQHGNCRPVLPSMPEYRHDFDGKPAVK
jgi:hypothetical protein